VPKIVRALAKPWFVALATVAVIAGIALAHPQPAHAAVPTSTHASIHASVHGSVHGQIVPTPPSVPTVPTPGNSTGTNASGGDGKATISLDFGNPTGTSNGTANGTPGQSNSGGNQSIFIILLLTVLSVAPALLIMMTGFTRIVIVLSLTRNALGLNSVPPNPVIAGLALFLSIFVMYPTLSQVNKVAVQPLLDGTITARQAYDAGMQPMRAFMFKQTKKSELAMFIHESKGKKPEGPKDVSTAVLVPAFVLSELKTAFIIGFIIFIPFLIIDLVVSSSLTSMGMFMLPPVIISLPFKLLLFVMVDGWDLVVNSLLHSFR
jgi:flagellar biosynthesis protein FliP